MYDGVQMGGGSLAAAISPAKAAMVAMLFVSVVLVLPCASSAATPPYEPNNAVLEAAGPLFANQMYFGALETPGDRDFFYFYVTSPTEAQVTLTVSNLGGGNGTADINTAILNTSATPLSAISYLREGESRTLSLPLPPQKYFLEIIPTSGAGPSYSLTTGGATGAFGPYAAIEGRCSSARHKLAKARAGLNRAQAKLQRATARLRRSRYADVATRREARLAHRKARLVVKRAHSTAKAARGSREPWCSITA
jgi:hypothetical protein